jgi:hypothetical protein
MKRRSKYTYIPKDEISEVITFNNVSFESDDLLDGAYVKGRKKYARGGNMRDMPLEEQAAEAVGYDVWFSLDAPDKSELVEELVRSGMIIPSTSEVDMKILELISQNDEYMYMADGGMMADGGEIGDSVIVELNNGKKIEGKIEKLNPFKIRTSPSSTEVIPNPYIKSVKKSMADGGMMAKGGEIEVGDYVKYKKAKYHATVIDVVNNVDIPYAKIEYPDGMIVRAYLQDLRKIQLGVAEEYSNTELMDRMREEWNEKHKMADGGMMSGGMMAKGGKVGYTNKFQEIYDGGIESYYIRKFGGVIKDYLNDKNVELVAVANIKDLEEWVSADELPEDGNFNLNITLIPLAEYMSYKLLDQANDEDTSSISNNSEVNIVNYMGGLSYNPQEEFNFKTKEDAEKYLYSKNLNDRISSDVKMIGNILDNNYNRAGQSNYDYLDYMTGVTKRFSKGGMMADGGMPQYGGMMADGRKLKDGDKVNVLHDGKMYKGKILKIHSIGSVDVKAENGSIYNEPMYHIEGIMADGGMMADGGVATAGKFKVKYYLKESPELIKEKIFDDKDKAELFFETIQEDDDIMVSPIEEMVMAAASAPKKSLFASAKPVPASTAAAKKKRERVQVDGISGEISRYDELKAVINNAKAEQEVIGGRLKEIGREKFMDIYEDRGFRPPNFDLADGNENILLEVKDMYLKVEPEKAAILEQYSGLLEVKTTYSFNTELLEKEVSEGMTIGDVLSMLIQDSKLIPDSDKENLIKSETTMKVAKGTIDRLLDYDNPREIFNLISPILALK